METVNLEAVNSPTWSVYRSTTPLRSPFASMSDDRWFIVDDRQALCIDPVVDPKTALLIEKGNFKMVSAMSGGFSYQYGADPDSIDPYFGPLPVKYGYDAIPPVSSTILQGDLVKTYSYLGKNFNFLGAHNKLCKMMDAENYIVANVYKGSVQDILTQIDMCSGSQRLIHVQFGEEGDKSWWTPQEYATKALEMKDEVVMARPNVKIRWVWDIPTIYNNGKPISKSVQDWINGIWDIYGPVADKNNWAIRQYMHLFKGVTLTGNVQADKELIDEYITNGLPAFAAAIDNSVFSGHRVILRQVSANEFASTPYQSEVTANMHYLVQFYPRLFKFIADSLRDGGTRFVGQNMIGMNRWITYNRNGQLVPNLDFEWVSVQNMLPGDQVKSSKVEHNVPILDVVGGILGGSDRFVIQNRGSIPVSYPSEINIDGIIVPFNVETISAKYCDNDIAMTHTDYFPDTNRLWMPRSIQFCKMI